MGGIDVAIITVDFDGTLYRGDSFKMMFMAVKKDFKGKQWAILFAGLMKSLYLWITKGKEAFRLQFFKSFAKSFEGKTAEQLDNFFYQLVLLGKEDIHMDLIKKIKEHQANGDTIIILSGALHPFLKAFVKEVDLDVHVISTELLYDESGLCTGEIGTIINGEKKVDKVLEWIEIHNNCKKTEIWAYADSESDIPLFRFVQYPIVVNPNEGMKKIANENNWPIFPS